MTSLSVGGLHWVTLPNSAINMSAFFISEFRKQNGAMPQVTNAFVSWSEMASAVTACSADFERSCRFTATPLAALLSFSFLNSEARWQDEAAKSAPAFFAFCVRRSNASSSQRFLNASAAFDFEPVGRK